MINNPYSLPSESDCNTGLANLQTEWDNNDVEGETSEEKISRLGARPTSYSS